MDAVNLFTRKADERYSTLPDNPQDWDQAILSKLFGRYPDLAQFIVDLEYTKQNLDMLTAIGSVSVAGPTVKIFFPVIVLKGKLVPFEVFIDKDGNFNHATLERVLYNLNFGGAFAQVRKQVFPDTVSPMMSSMYPPFSKPIFKMAETAKGFINNFKTVVAELPGNYPKLDRILTAYETLVQKLETKQINHPSPYNILQIRPTYNGQFKLILSSNSIYGPVEVTTNVVHVETLLSEFGQTMEQAFDSFKNGGFYTCRIGNTKAPLSVIDTAVNPQLTAETVMFAANIIPTNKSITQGFYIPNLVRFGEYALNLTIPFAKGGIIFNNYSYQRVPSNVSGTKLNSFQPHHDAISAGDIGMFYSPSLGVGTVPFTVLHLTRHGSSYSGDSTLDITITTNGNPIKLGLDQHRDGTFRIPLQYTSPSVGRQHVEEPKRNILVEDAFKHSLFINLGSRTLVPELANEVLATQPGISETLPLFYIAKGAENTYKLSFPGVRDYDNQHQVIPTSLQGTPLNLNFNALEPADAHLILAHLGVNTKNADAILKLADKKKIVKLSDFQFPKVYEYQAKKAERHMGISLSKGLLVKLAELSTQVPDEDNSTVNGILKLGLMTIEDEKDLETIVAHLDKVIGNGAKLLIMARLGVKELDADLISSVLNDLENIRAHTIAIKPLTQS